MGSCTGDTPVEIIADGQLRSLTVGLVVPLEKEGKGYIRAAQDEFINYNTGPRLPIVINMRAGFSINPEEIITK